MAGEKARMAREIVARIDALSFEASESFENDFKEAFGTLKEEFEKEQEALLNKKINDLKQHLQNDLRRKQADYNVSRKEALLKYRSALFADFEQALKEKLDVFLESDAYRAAVRQKLDGLDSSAHLWVREEDKSLFEGRDYEIKDLVFGGFIAKLDERIFDFTYEQSFNAVLEKFIENSGLKV